MSVSVAKNAVERDERKKKSENKREREEDPSVDA
jgi:hypothetical protein